MADTRDRSANLTDSLTEREQEILACLAEGLSNQAIANRLYLAEKTVRWYNSQIYSKLGAGNRTEAVARATALGLLAALPEPPVTGRHNLPAQGTPFVGRGHELAELRRLLNDDRTRLVTILAPGGMGKTRLSLEAARTQIGRYTDGVFFVALAPLSSPDDIVTTIAENIGIRFHGQDSPARQQVDFLKDRAVLLVLDNFEHLLAGAPLVTDIIQGAPHVKVLATSREKLNLSAETVFTLSGLQFSDWQSPNDVLEYDAVKLFIQSAHRIRPGFTLQPDQVEYLARICQLTAGMPLAIELAAGWVDVLSLEQIAAEIQQGIDILETDLRDIPERHRSIRATFERTWTRLSPDEQAAFARLSVFRGGFDLPAAQAITGANALDLRRLSQKALIQSESSERFAIHDLLRQFGAGQLAADELAAVEARHASYFTNFMAEREQDIRTTQQREATERIDLDFENIRTAWLHLVKQHEWEKLTPFLHVFWFYCDARTRGQEAVDLLEAALTELQSVPADAGTELTLGRLLACLSWAYHDVGFPPKGADAGDEAIRILRRYPDSPQDLLVALRNRHFSAQALKQPDVAVNVTKEGLHIARSIGDPHWEGLYFGGAAAAWLQQNAFERAQELAERGLAILEKLGDRGLIMYAYNILAIAHLWQGHSEQAKQYFEQGLVFAEWYGHTGLTATNHTYLALIALRERDFASARRRLRIALKRYWDTNHRWVAPFAIVYIAQVFAEQNNPDRAIEILASIDPHLISLRNTDKIAHALRAELEANVEPERFAAAWARGQEQEFGALVAELLVDLAET
jgi:predicted ATPase/DNA-binding CsgD family transcriptional regulator